EVVGHLARKGIGCAGNRCDGSAIEAVRLEKCACRVEKAGPHLLAGGAGCPRAMTGGAGTRRAATRTILGAYAADVIAQVPYVSRGTMSALGHKRTFALHQPMSALPPKATSNAT